VVKLTARKKDKGFTLVEVMVALLVLFISMMASLHALGLAVAYNMDKDRRGENERVEEFGVHILGRWDNANQCCQDLSASLANLHG